MGVVSTYHDASLGLGVVALLVADHPRVDHLRAVSHHLMKEKKGLVCKIFDDFSFHLFDQSLLHQLNESPPGEGASHLEKVVISYQKNKMRRYNL